MHYVLDRFHAGAHVDAWCRQNVHPDLAEHAALIQPGSSPCVKSSYSDGVLKIGNWNSCAGSETRFLCALFAPFALLIPDGSQLQDNQPFVDGRNSSRCEILFAWLRRYKHLLGESQGQWWIFSSAVLRCRVVSTLKPRTVFD